MCVWTYHTPLHEVRTGVQVAAQHCLNIKAHTLIIAHSSMVIGQTLLSLRAAVAVSQNAVDGAHNRICPPGKHFAKETCAHGNTHAKDL
jgi:hypothetical protein